MLIGGAFLGGQHGGVEKKTPIGIESMGAVQREYRNEWATTLTSRINSCKPDAKKKPPLTGTLKPMGARMVAYLSLTG
jgi:hypothetical protein